MSTYHEKAALERVETKSDAESRGDPHLLNKVETHETLAAVDVENHYAFKGDDSDGVVAWTLQKLLAAGFLSLLYTGQQRREEH